MQSGRIGPYVTLRSAKHDLPPQEFAARMGFWSGLELRGDAMIRHPQIVQMTDLPLESLDSNLVRVPTACLVTSNRIGRFGFLARLRAAWLVFTGRADALVWPDDNR